MIAVERLGPGDEDVLVLLARQDADFDLDDGGPTRPLGPTDAAAFLADPSVLHWVARDGDRIVGHLLAYVERRRAGDPRQVLLYEIGVRQADRRRGAGRALVEELRRWMEHESVCEAWVLADNEDAQAFYAACGFRRDELQGVHMVLTRPDRGG